MLQATQINWWIDNRQISDGEFGGGLSDDTDYLNWWPGLAFMGADPDKLKQLRSSEALEAIYANDMWDNGLAKAQYDELHTYEDGINILGQAMQLDFGSPKQLERAMVTAKRLEWLTGINSAGQRQIRSSYYSGTKMAEDGVWGWAKPRSYFVFHPALSTRPLQRRARDPQDGPRDGRRLPRASSHRRQRHVHTMHYTVNFNTNEDLPGAQ